MNITINIPELSELAAAINNLASAVSSSSVGSTETAPSAPKQSRKAVSAGAAEKPAAAADAAEAKDPAPELKPAPAKVDAGTGEPLPEKPAEASEPVTLSLDDIKKKAIALTQLEGGKARLAGFFAKYEATKFSEVSQENLPNLAADLIEAGV